MPVRVVKDGTDPLTKPVLDYLAERYDIPPTDIRKITLDSEIGNAQTITVTLLVRADDPAAPAVVNVPLIGETREELPRTPYGQCAVGPCKLTAGHPGGHSPIPRRPHLCELCGGRFALAPALNLHRRDVHGI